MPVTAASNKPLSKRGLVAALWALAGFTMLLCQAIYKLFAISLDAMAYDFSKLQVFALIANVIFMAYSEGYKGFHKGFAPRFASRALHLYRSGTFIERLLAPLYCMNFFNATKRRMIVSYGLLLIILAFIFLFQIIPQPWRGILDAGVVVGLVLGLLSTFYFFTLNFMQYFATQRAAGNTTT